jgi:N-acetylneuraminic acid mutarotase
MTENNTYWRKIDQVNPIRPRESHVSLTLQQRYILIYGGYSPEETTYDDFWLFDTQKFTWIPINNIQGVLEPRIGSSITSVNKEIYMFGG